MTFKTALFLLFFVFSFVTSCRTSRQVVQKNDTLNETIRERFVNYRDTTLFSPASQTALKLPIALLQHTDLNSGKTPFKPLVYSQKNGNATAKIRIQHDTIIVEAKCDSLALVAKIKEQYLSELSNSKHTSDSQELRSKGVPVFKTILFTMLAFAIGFGMAFLLKTFKII